MIHGDNKDDFMNNSFHFMVNGCLPLPPDDHHGYATVLPACVIKTRSSGVTKPFLT